MSRFTVHGIIGSPFMRSVLMCFEEKGVPYQLHSIRPGEHKQPDYLALNPFGRIPAMTDGDFKLYETQAILRYLDRLFPQPALIPADARVEARMNQLIGINDWYVFPEIGVGIVFHRIIAPMIGLPSDEAKVKETVPKAETCGKEIAHLLGDQPFMAGNALSIADLMLAPQLEYFAATPEGQSILASAPNIGAWLSRMAARERRK